jgi:hypothetical protein
VQVFATLFHAISLPAWVTSRHSADFHIVSPKNPGDGNDFASRGQCANHRLALGETSLAGIGEVVVSFSMHKAYSHSLLNYLFPTPIADSMALAMASVWRRISVSDSASIITRASFSVPE